MAKETTGKVDAQAGAAGAFQMVEEFLDTIQIPPVMLHLALVFFAGWIATLWNANMPLVFLLGFLYILHIEKRHRLKHDMRVRHDERRLNDRKRLLTDAETGRWINNVVETIWPIFMEKFASEHFLMRIAPYFLKKFKPWTAKKIVLNQLYLGRRPPVFTFFRAGRHPTDGDQLVLEMTMSFSAASDMKASMAVQVKKRLGLGFWTSFHVSGIQVEGKVKVGVRFVNGWPLIGRLRICFSEPPIVRLVAKPVFSYGVDVTDLPGIAAWLDKMIVDALEQSLVEPQMLVLDVEKLLSDIGLIQESLSQFKKPTDTAGKEGQDWYCIQRRPNLAVVVVEILEADKLKPCDANGKADPYVRIILDQTQHETSIKRKTLSPNWHETFRLPVQNWDSSLLLRVRDKDRFSDDDEMGYKSIKISDMRGGERQDLWLPLDGVKTGVLRVAVTVEEVSPAEQDVSPDIPQGDVALTRSVSAKDGLMSSRGEVPGTSMKSDYLDTQGRLDHFTPVDVGFGPPGSVSIVTPGKDVLKEAHYTEKARQRKKINKELARMEKENVKVTRDGGVAVQVNAENHPSNAKGDTKKSKRHMWSRRKEHKLSNETFGSESSEEAADDVELVEHSNAEKLQRPSAEDDMKSSKRKSLWPRQKSRPRSDVSPEEATDERTELVAVGEKGTRIHLTLDPPDGTDEHGEEQNFDYVSQGSTEGGEIPDEMLSEEEKHRKREMVKKQATKMFKVAGKTAHQTLRKFHSSKDERGRPIDGIPLDEDNSLKGRSGRKSASLQRDVNL